MNAWSEDSSTPLHLASIYRELKVARVLIEHGADRGAEDKRGRTPFQVAGDGHMAEFLSDHGSE